MQESPCNALGARKLRLPAHTTDQLDRIVAFEYLKAPSLSLSLSFPRARVRVRAYRLHKIDRRSEKPLEKATRKLVALPDL